MRKYYIKTYGCHPEEHLPQSAGLQPGALGERVYRAGMNERHKNISYQNFWVPDEFF